MENMVARSADGSIITIDPVATRERHLLFDSDSSKKYSYQCNSARASFYVFNYFEFLCWQCGFFTWDDLSKFTITNHYSLYDN